LEWYEKGFDLAYGPSGSGKTKSLMDLAEFIHITTGKRTRWYIGDGGRATIDASGLVEDNIVEVWDYNNRPYPLTVIQQMTEGYWPEDTEDPKSKLIAPGVKEFQEVGMWVFEGLYVVSEFIMGSAPGALADRASKGEKIGQDSPVNVTDPSGLKFGGNPMAHYQFAQRRVTDAIQRTKALPGYKAWTSHETMAEDKDNGNEKLIGPGGPGRAMTPKLPLWFANTFHFTTATKKVKKKDPSTGKDVDVYETERRVYTREHGDPDGTVYIKYLANSRVATHKDAKGNIVNPMPEYLSPPDLLKFYEIVETSKAKAREGRKTA
jgi:hypothetical protein